MLLFKKLKRAKMRNIKLEYKKKAQFSLMNFHKHALVAFLFSKIQNIL